MYVGQSAVALSDRSVWMCDSGAGNHMTGDATNVFSHKGQEWVTIGDGTVKKDIFAGT